MKLTWLSNYRDLGLLLLRIGTGALLIHAGWPKLAAGIHGPHGWEEIGKAMGVLGIHFLPAFWGFACAVTETFGGVLVLFGFYFRVATILLTFNFIVATVMMYKSGNPMWTYPGEILLLCFSLIFIGPGKYSVDRS